MLTSKKGKFEEDDDSGGGGRGGGGGGGDDDDDDDDIELRKFTAAKGLIRWTIQHLYNPESKISRLRETK